MPDSTPPPRWTRGEVYEPYVGRWSRLVAAQFVDWLSVPAGGNWVDVGCGTGALSQTVLTNAEPRMLAGVDRSPAILDFARAHTPDRRATFAAADAQALPFLDEVADAVVSGLVLNFIPDRPGMIREMRRVAREGGVVALYVWDYAGRMDMMRYFWDAAAQVSPDARDRDEAVLSPVCAPGPLAELFGEGGLTQVEVEAIDVPTVFRDFDDFWTPFLSGQAPAPAYLMSLPEEKRTELRDLLNRRLPIENDGTIHMIARAWAVQGRRP